MKIRVLLLLAVVLSVLRVAAADEVPRIPDFYFDSCESRFAEATAYFNEALDIKILLPDGFVDKNRRGHYVPKSKQRRIGVGLTFNAMAESIDGECLLLVQDESLPVGNFEKMGCDDNYKGIRADVYWSVKGTFSLNYLRGNPPLVDMRKYVKPVDASRINADKACLVKLPVNGDTLGGKRYVGKTILFFEEAGRVPMGVTLLFTADGLKNRAKYEAALLESVGYGNRNWKYDKNLDRMLEIRYFAPYVALIERQHAKQETEFVKKLAKEKCNCNQNCCSQSKRKEK